MILRTMMLAGLVTGAWALATASAPATSEGAPGATTHSSGSAQKQDAGDEAKALERWPSVMSTGLRTADLQRATRFYTEGLGMVVLGKVESAASTEVVFGFAGRKDEPGIIVFQDKGANRTTPVEHGNADTKIVIGVRDAIAIARRLTAAGYSAGDIHEHGPYKILIAHDPDGYKFEIVEMPATTKPL
jgi:catechol 2,3-dioxygenase-like lactoylglutathione lyase family enzyme